LIRQVIDKSVRATFRLLGLGQNKRWDFSRNGMYCQIEDFVKAQASVSLSGSVLSISHSQTLIDCLGIKASEQVEANYPDENILNLPFADNRFDWVLSDQVFEHIVGDPQRAMDESLRVLKPGGQLLHTTCFLTPYHGCEGELEDFWRFSPNGLAYLARSANKIHADGCGHPLPNLLTSFGLAFEPTPSARWHPLNRLSRLKSRGHNALVWVYAQK
jgi:SAM-dependent methyltransferase